MLVQVVVKLTRLLPLPLEESPIACPEILDTPRSCALPFRAHNLNRLRMQVFSSHVRKKQTPRSPCTAA